MKIRQGFVTNSSSSSFVICFKDENNDKKQIMKELVEYYNGDQEQAQNVYDTVMGSVEYVKGRKYRDYFAGKKAFLDEIQDEEQCSSSWSSYLAYTNDENKEMQNEATKSVADKMKDFKKAIQGATALVKIEIGDGDGTDTEYVMSHLVGDGIVLATYSHH